MTTFHRNWLTIWCLGVGLFGLLLYGAGHAATTGPAAALFALFGNPLPVEPDRYLRFTISLMGAVTFGWAATLYAAFRAAWWLDGAAAAPIWRLITAGVLVWWAIDSAASIATGFGINAVSNTIVLVLFLVPVLASGVLSPTTARTGTAARPQVG